MGGDFLAHGVRAAPRAATVRSERLRLPFSAHRAARTSEGLRQRVATALWPPPNQGARPSLTVRSRRRDVLVRRPLGAQRGRHQLQACGVAEREEPVASDVERAQPWGLHDELCDVFTLCCGLPGAHPPVVETRLWDWPRAASRADPAVPVAEATRASAWSHPAPKPRLPAGRSGLCCGNPM